MIKILFSDLDGTLIKYGTKEVEPEVFEAIKELTDSGVAFCPASGRVHDSLRRMFAPVADDVYFICENGSAVYYKGELIGSKSMPHDEIVRIARLFWNNTDGKGEILFTTPAKAYIMERGMGMKADIDGRLGLKYEILHDVEEAVDPDICKLALCIHDGVEPYADMLIRECADWYPTVSGFDWFDVGCAGKGTGVRMVCESLGIDPADAAVFGDNYNDVDMLDAVGHPFIMENACEDLRNRYPEHVVDPTEKIREIIKANAADKLI